MSTVTVKGVTIRIDNLDNRFGHTFSGDYRVGREPARGIPDTRPLAHESTRMTKAYWNTIYRTLEILPVAHLQDVVARNIILINNSLRGGGGSARLGYINISPHCLDNNYNTRLNATLLHEIGHKMDTARNCVGRMSDIDQVFMRHVLHEGGTQGPGESYADCYMDYFLGGTAKFNMAFPLQPDGLSFTYRGRTIQYSGLELNQHRLRLFLSVTPNLI